ncbi:MAG: FtsW/RodA/SpoVE family cell cycle protein, partial [Pseudomonadales bacterium]|nr:FtsW/RodA/SpoVE family cell cycle protein [Pseudomonadales bacterium]
MASKTTVMSVHEEPCPVDILILVCVGTLLAMGVLLVASASSEISARDYGNTLYLVIRHIVFIGLAIGMGIITLMVPLEVWRRSGWLMVVVSYLVLAAVLVPGIGKEVNGSTRWIPLGFFTLQGSEFVKLMMVMFIASYMTNQENRDHALGFLKAMAAIVGVVALLLLQPDLGSAVVIFVAFFGVIFLSGTPFRFLLPVIVAAFSSLVVL